MTEEFVLDKSRLTENQRVTFTVPPLVKGRVCHIDADFLAYQVSADENKSVPEMKSNCDTRIEKLRLMAGAERTVLHLTPSGSEKGYRYEAAMLKEYQGNRKDKPKPKFLHTMREFMHKERGAIMHIEIEADDGMAQEQYSAIERGEGHLSIIASKDKDLCMVPGLMLDWDTGEITDIDDAFGWLKLDDSKSSKKVIGRGSLFFWAQLLMGDTADNISGLPLVHDTKYLAASGKPKACGPVMTYDILSTVKNDKEAFELLKHLYKLHGEAVGFKNYRDGTTVEWGAALASEMRLLWMRRSPEPNDCLKWIKEKVLCATENV